VTRELEAGEAVDYLLAHDFCNPHLLVKDGLKLELRKGSSGSCSSKPMST